MPDVPSNGRVWTSIREHYREVGYEDEYVTVSHVSRTKLAKHPWSLGGGGAPELRATLEAKKEGDLRSRVSSIGFMVITGEDDIFTGPSYWTKCHKLPAVVFGPGDSVRDWGVHSTSIAIFDYDPQWDYRASANVSNYLWPWRVILQSRLMFGKTQLQAGLHWAEFRHVGKDKVKAPLSIAFAFVSSHNHFVLDRGGTMFNRSAPVVKLLPTATEDDHLALLAFLNSSVVGFWGRNTLYPKGGDQMGDGARLSKAAWEDRLEWAGTPLENLFLPPGLDSLLPIGRTLDQLARRLEDLGIGSWVTSGQTQAVNRAAVEKVQLERELVRRRMVALQEELDWRVYGLFGLPTVIDDSILVNDEGLLPNSRSFEVRLARKVASGEEPIDWFDRNDRMPIVDLDELGVSAQQKSVIEKRLFLIEQHRELRILEAPEHKRRWPPLDSSESVKRACHEWLCDRIEQRFLDISEIRAIGPRDLARELREDPMVRLVAELLLGESEMNLDALFTQIMMKESVPYCAALRYTDSGLVKRFAWEQTWVLQRRFDSGEKVDVVVPPRYDTKDFRDLVFWGYRGKLDVPKERWISYPGLESNDDGQPLFGSAGWDHLQQAGALAALFTHRRNNEGWVADRLTPVLAGILELIPWLRQWHNEPDARFGGARAGDQYSSFVEAQAAAIGLSLDDLRSWRPQSGPKKKRSRRA